MHVLLTLVATLPLHAAGGGEGEPFLSREEALELAFDGCKVTRSTVTLTAEQRAKVEKLSGSRVTRSIVYPYVATKDGKVCGTAWFDVHRVRTLREALMFVVGPKGKIRRIEMLAFGEPREYIPRPSWYAQFIGKGLDETLSLKKGIKKVTGASLTARATTDAARRVLAVHQVWLASQVPPPAKKPK